MLSSESSRKWLPPKIWIDLCKESTKNGADTSSTTSSSSSSSSMLSKKSTSNELSLIQTCCRRTIGSLQINGCVSSGTIVNTTKF
jgi:hypothetical protein